MKLNKPKLKTVKIEDLGLLRCKKCIKGFSVDKNFLGVITCPYCGNYVEG